ncbi:MAG: hypothetical protein ACRDSL_20530 [Pseudonocardiaceae bacterium]
MTSAPRRRVPGWLRLVLAIGCLPILIGVMMILARTGVSGPVLIGGLVGPLAAAVWHHRRTRRSTP